MRRASSATNKGGGTAKYQGGGRSARSGITVSVFFVLEGVAPGPHGRPTRMLA
jgi:hypothetical protein